MYQQVLKPVGDSLRADLDLRRPPDRDRCSCCSVCVKVRAWVAALISLGVAVLVAVVVYSMPVGQTLLSATEGAAFGFFPILWIVINAIWVYNLTVETGHFDVLRRSFERGEPRHADPGDHHRLLFGALLEALAGFGTPVAISSVMLIALGFPAAQGRDRLADREHRPGGVRRVWPSRSSRWLTSPPG